VHEARRRVEPDLADERAPAVAERVILAQVGAGVGLDERREEIDEIVVRPLRQRLDMRLVVRELRVRRLQLLDDRAAGST